MENEDKIKEILKKYKNRLRWGKSIFRWRRCYKDYKRRKSNQFRIRSIKNAIVRTNLVELQRRISEGKNIVLDGRDIGTVVFPNAEIKIYLDASSEERAKKDINKT